MTEKQIFHKDLVQNFVSVEIVYRDGKVLTELGLDLDGLLDFASTEAKKAIPGDGGVAEGAVDVVVGLLKKALHPDAPAVAAPSVDATPGA